MKVVLIVLEVFGLVLAFLDFFEVSPKIQAWIDRHRKLFFLWLRDKNNEQIATSRPFMLALGIPAWALFFWFLYAAITQSPKAMTLFLWYVVVSLGPLVLLYVLLPLLYNALLTINKGPGHTVGKISLMVAVASSILQRFAF